MKLYEKIIDGKQHIMPAKKIIIKKDGMQTFNPTEEMLLADGWKVHEPVPYEPTAEEISEKLVVSISTTKAHVHSILQKLYIQGRAKAAVFAVQEGLV